MKAPLDPRNDQDLYNPQTNKNNTLFSGTKVIQTRLYGGSKVTGLVVRTGFNTAKGMLVNSILYPKPNQFRFYNDSFKFIGIMFVIGAIGFTFSAFALYRLRVRI
jgi:cation-transporting ATPase 13A2